MRFFVLYLLVCALSVPGAALFTLAGGVLFGLGWGLLLVSFASSLGATLAFWSARYLLGVNDPRVFAAGDTAAIVGHPLEKAGVFAVWQARLLAANLRRCLAGTPLLHYQPQRRLLALISAGNRHAVASYGGIGLTGDWVWQVKTAIDRRFVRRFVRRFATPQEYQADEIQTSNTVIPALSRDPSPPGRRAEVGGMDCESSPQ